MSVMARQGLNNHWLISTIVEKMNIL